MRTIDLGTILSLTGASILTTYAEGAAKAVGSAGRVRATLRVVSIGGTAITSVQAKLQASSDGAAGWHDIESQGDEDATSTTALEHSITITAGTTQEVSFAVEGPFDFIRLAAKATGGAGQAGESLTGSADAQL